MRSSFVSPPARRRFMRLSVLLPVLSGCASGLVFEVEDQSIGQLALDRPHAEIASAVIPPDANEGCTGGRLFIVSASGAAPVPLVAPPYVFTFQQLQAGATQNLVPQAGVSFSPTADDRYGSADILLTRLPHSGLLMTLQSSTTASLSPQPAWWNDFMTHPELDPGERTGQSMWRSYDCGQSWERLAGIDPALVLDGDCARPQWDSAPPGFWRGGFDRSELHVNPWSGTVFLTAGCMSGGVNGRSKLHRYLLFVSQDSGSTWKATGPWFQRAAPLMMTSAPSGRLYLLQCAQTSPGSGYFPLLYWTDPPWTTVGGPAEVAWDPATPNSNLCAYVDNEAVAAEVSGLRVLTPALSRAGLAGGGDLIRVAFPAVEDGRQVERVASVVVTASGAVTQLPRLSIAAQDPDGSVLHATFVETNRFDFPEFARQDVDVALLYWLETAGATVFVRGALVDQENRWTEPFDLSATAGVRTPWTPTAANIDWMGDYMKGTFYYAEGELRFIAAWPVAALAQLRWATVAVEMPLKSVGGLKPLLHDPDVIKSVPVPYKPPEGLQGTEGDPPRPTLDVPGEEPPS